MEFTSRPQEIREKQPYSYSPINSPRSNGTNTNTKTNTNNSVCSSNTNNNNNSSGVQIPTTPKVTTPRSDPNPYPTTFVQADTTNFKHVVQMLTGSSETVSHQSSPNQPQPIITIILTAIKIQPFCPPPTKASTSHQSKQPLPKSKASSSMRGGAPISKNTLMINTLMPNFPHQASGFSPRHQEILSPSLLDFPSLTLSPVTPLNDDPFDKSSSSPSLGNSSSEEDRAIAEKGFYLHPSPRTTTTPRDPEPRLLPLFPVTSPRVSGSSS